jgi:hypothetical protein
LIARARLKVAVDLRATVFDPANRTVARRSTATC